MVAIKTQKTTRFISNPDPGCHAVLVYGPDAGLVSERASTVASAFGKRDPSGGEIIRIDDIDLESDPARLSVELQTVPMFGGGKVVRSNTGRRINAALLKDVFADGPTAAAFVCEAGNLKPTDALRKLFESTPWAAAVACYADTEKDLAGLVDELVTSAKMTIGAQAREILVSRLGADRALSRGEIEKLVLYCHGRARIEIDDIEAIVGDATETTMDGIVMAAASGDPAGVAREFDRAINAGENAQVLIGAAQRHFQRLHRIRVAIDEGQPLDAALKSLRPPVHFKLKDALAAQCRLWRTRALSEALQRIASAAQSARLNSAMDAVLAERLLINLAVHAQQQQPRS